jgi:uncharacterized membrane protein
MYGIFKIWPYSRAFFCKSHKRKVSDACGMVFIHIGFFAAIVFMFEGQERYAHPVLLFFIYAVVWLFGRIRINPMEVEKFEND